MKAESVVYSDTCDENARESIKRRFLERYKDCQFNEIQVYFCAYTLLVIVETEIPDERKWWHRKEDFVISGISGRYPESENVKEFLQNLYAGVDMITVDFGENGDAWQKIFFWPSMTFDTACSTTFLAIHNAIDALRRGQCEAAIICSAHVTLSFHVSLMFFRMGMLSPTGTCQSFDASGNGYVRGECIGSIFIQRASNARRVYATIVHAKSNTDGYKAEGITFPSPIQQVTLLKETYQEAGVNPNDVKYVEAHGTGTAVGDFVEGISLTNTFLRGARKVPLLIGSVKSNCGHPEPSSGIAALTKVIGALQYSCVPQNLHYTSPSTSIPALVDGRLKVVDKNIPWPLDSNVVALNNFGFGGSNTHIILRANEKIVHNVKFSDNKNDIPTLLLHSGRTKKTLENVFALFKVHNQNLYLYRMLMEQSLTNVHLFPHPENTL